MKIPRSEGLVGIIITTVMIVAGYAALTPVLPLFGGSLGLGAVQVGVVIGAFGFARFCLDLLGGFLGDRVGFRRIAVLGCLTVAAGAFLSAQADSYAALLAGQLLAGTGSALFTTSTFTVVIMRADPAAKARVLSFYQGAVLVAFSIGPAVGGLIGGFLGLRLPFVLYGTLALLCVAMTFPSVPRQVTVTAPAEQQGSSATALKRLLTEPVFLISLVVITGGYGIRTGVRNTMVPLFAADELGMAVAMVGAVLTVAVLVNAVLLPHAGSSLDRFGRRPVTIISTAAIAFTVVLLGLVQETWQLFPVVALLGAVSAYAGLAPVAILADVIDQAAPGIGVGLQRMGLDLGMMLGPPLAGMGMDRIGFRSTCFAFGLFIAVVSAVSVRAPETISRDTRS